MMDSIINFLGANPYQAIAVPVIGGFASGYSLSPFILMVRLLREPSEHYSNLVPNSS